jgi:hypothetical protein
MNYALFERINVQKAATPTLQFLVTVSYFELYNEVIFVSSLYKYIYCRM